MVGTVRQLADWLGGVQKSFESRVRAQLLNQRVTIVIDRLLEKPFVTVLSENQNHFWNFH